MILTMGRNGKSSSKDQKMNPALQNLKMGQMMVASQSLFSALREKIWVRTASELPGGRGGDGGKNASNKNASGGYAWVDGDGHLWLDHKKRLEPEQWAFVIAHCLLHLAFGHFDKEKLPRDAGGLDQRLWNSACDLYIHKFLTDLKFGAPLVQVDMTTFGGGLQNEEQIYRYLIQQQVEERFLQLGTAGWGTMDMVGLSRPKTYPQGMGNRYAAVFAGALAYSVSDAVSIAGGHGGLTAPQSPAAQAASWFLSSYPLLGGLAASFRIVEDYDVCRREEIGIAAVDVTAGEIYINPARKLSRDELRFVMAHEFLHAGLLHHQRSLGRDPYLWNVACDFVINGWLLEMGVGSMPQEGLLYDQRLAGRSAEEIYDEIVRDLRASRKYNTFRGAGQGDIMSGGRPGNRVGNLGAAVDLDEFYRNALSQGLELHSQQERGLLPAGLVEEIRALSVPPIPWEVELAGWFDQWFGPLERMRTYGRASRRQAATPDIPRPGVKQRDSLAEGRTFGVVLDTSGSMDGKLLGKALGAVASYAASRDVPFVRVVFCDAVAYDAGYLAPEDIAGRVEIRGRGGTILQPGIDLLQQADDFPKQGPILTITDGGCEPKVSVSREHAWLLPAGGRLPFRDKGKIFYFQ